MDDLDRIIKKAKFASGAVMEVIQVDAVCPYCETSCDDGFEYHGGDVDKEINCRNCEKPFRYSLVEDEID